MFGLPFASITAWTCGMLSMSLNFFLRNRPPSFFHKSFKLSKIFRFFFFFFFSSLPPFLRLCLISSHRFSIVLRSRLWAGQESIWRDFSSRNSVAILLQCGGTLPSWNHPSIMWEETLPHRKNLLVDDFLVHWISN